MTNRSALGILLGLAVAAAIGVGLWLTSGSSEGTATTGATLSRGWNNVSYQGDTLPVVQALNDAVPVVDSIWQWDGAAQDWTSWTKGAPSVVNTLANLTRDRSYWMHTTNTGTWTFRGASTATTGQDGLNCWDLNGNGQFDSGIEDNNSDGAASALDCQGATGPVGPAGPAGTAATLPSGAVTGVEVVDSGLALPSGATVGDTQEKTVSCGASQIVIGGGGTAGGSGTIAAIEDSAPTGGTPPREWRVKASVISTSGFAPLWGVTAYAVCADVVP